ncbi:efflux RND transporter periplasmic adaptor subunit [Agrilactobacillus fermenti]|uniref:efflux RND transporter periplasmic adaptor subunit n=1 Tax=Agrilactobacillus fermenti TaxID=2586909 RepID=UPI003A5C708E
MKSVFKKRGFIIGLVIVVVLIIAMIGIGIARSRSSNHTNYQIVTIKRDSPLLLKGQIASDNTVDVTTPVSGTLTLSQINVQDGQHVEAGQVLMTLHDSSAEDQLYEAQASLAKARLAVQQDQQALNQAQQATAGAQDQSGIQQARNQLSQDELAVSQGETQVSNLQNRLNPIVKASISGTISLDDTANTTTGMPSMKIISDGQVINGQISEYDYAKIRPQTQVTVLPISSGAKLKGTILSVDNVPTQSGAGSSATAATAGGAGAGTSSSSVSYYKFTVKIDQRLVNGFNVQIKVPQNTIRIPSAAIVKEKGKSYVYRVVKNKAVKTEVRVSKDNGVTYLDNGLDLKDKIVANPDKNMKSGQEVNSSAD